MRTARIEHDVYGSGALVEAFEDKVARLLGFPAAVFCISGTMAQVTALRLACADRGSAPAALHPTSHIFVHERSNYQLIGHFDALQMGDLNRPRSLADLEAVPDRLGAIGIAIPMREIGGQLSTWEELEAIKRHARRAAHTCTWTAHGCGSGRGLWPQRGRDRGRLRFGLCVAVQRDRRPWWRCWRGAARCRARRRRMVPAPGRQCHPPLALCRRSKHAVRCVAGGHARLLPPDAIPGRSPARPLGHSLQPGDSGRQHAAPAPAGQS
ncbi:beta-eliminating lyase-related protein [Massilia sp. Mn16-1_5]|uniref:beta-eliminating lyase-related protein n=1 Tax=Massilia sp. Mn16-1_5 TaxID=2079199 RepID=UPI0027D95045|nr:beta-eliminating lyase-related protein [Massilia sp. Mn16-1_5]